MIKGNSLLKNKKKTTTEIICDNLGLTYQTIFQDYKCIFKANISYFGRLYIGQEHLMFVSNMFGIVNKTAIVIDTISKISQPTQNSITITGIADKHNVEEEFTFSGFKNDNAFKIIKALWKKQKLSSQVLNSNNEEENDSGDKSLGGLKNLDDANVEINLFNPNIVEADKQKMLEIVLPCSVQQFYTFFMADDAEVYPRSKHLELKKSTKIVVTPWKKNEQLNAETRQISAMIKVKGVPFRSEASMNQVGLLSKNQKNQLTIKIITQIVDLPLSSYFTIEQHISITKQGETKCKYLGDTAIVFNKATYMKNTILIRTFADLREDYKMWSDNVKQILDRMKRQQQEETKITERKHNGAEVQYQALKVEGEKQQIKNTELVVESFNAKQQIRNLKGRINIIIKLLIVLIILSISNILLNTYSNYQHKSN